MRRESGGFGTGRELARKRLHPPRPVRRVAAGNDQANFAARTFREIGGEALVPVAVFEPGMHGAHQYAVPDGSETEIQRSQEIRIVRVVQVVLSLSD